MTAKYTLKDFLKEYPDDDACLEWLFQFMYPAGVHCHVCDKVTKHHRVRTRKSYSCDVCGHHVHPTAGTIYHKSSTPLTTWFYAVFLMSNTRTGVSAKHLQRETGVTYKTAHRMLKMIRAMLLEGQAGPLTGEVEVDETLVGGKPRRYKDHPNKYSKKATVIGAVERGGSVVAKVVPDNARTTCYDFVLGNVAPGTTLYTDEHSGYFRIGKRGYKHHTVTHWSLEYARGVVHTNTIEGFWGNFKTGFRGAYKHCAFKYLEAYVNEYAFRYNHRNSEASMFAHFMAQHRQFNWWVPYSRRGRKG
ncbi:MAG: IS1595 family transposase [Armatimonadetes bacterium]|nr:IS1595 family transposase [Armatimonadota bacterium]